jgi:hypothetical protein
MDLALAILKADYPRLRQVRPDVEANLEAVVRRGLSVERRQRFPSVMALGRALVELIPPERREPWEDCFAEDVLAVPAPVDPSPSVNPEGKRHEQGQVSTRIFAPDAVARLALSSRRWDVPAGKGAGGVRMSAAQKAIVTSIAARPRGPAALQYGRGFPGPLPHLMSDTVVDSRPREPCKGSLTRANRGVDDRQRAKRGGARRRGRLGVGLLSASAVLTVVWLVVYEREAHVTRVRVELPPGVAASTSCDGNSDERLRRERVGLERGERSVEIVAEKSGVRQAVETAPMAIPGSVLGRWQRWGRDERGKVVSRRGGRRTEYTRDGSPILW